MQKRQMFSGLNHVWSGWTHRVRQGALGAIAQNRLVQSLVARRWSILLLMMAFLLGRAMILDQLAPFAVAYFAVMYFLRRELLFWTGVFVAAGSLFSADPMHTGYIVAEMIVFVLIQKGVERFERSDISYAPLIVFTSTFFVQLFSHLAATKLSWYTLTMSGVGALLSLILTHIFLQAIPVFTLSRKNYNLKHEEVICLIILLASVMTGTVGWLIGPVTLEHVLSRYLILLFALVGGAPLGASVGVISGLILSLANSSAIYQMSLLAFAGMLAGLLREGSRMAVALGMLLGSSILSVYLGNQSEVLNSTWESVAAVALFLLTPRSVTQMLAKYVPGTQENLKSQQDYARRVRDVTANRVEQFSEVFKQLSRSFKQITADSAPLRREEEVGHFMNSVAEKSCGSCWKRKQCWDDKFYQTYKYMTDMMTEVELREDMTRKDIQPEWKKHCVKPDQVLEVMKQQYALYKHDQHWKKQIYDSRQLVAEQLSGVSQVMEDLAKEIKREGQELFMQEEQIRSALEELGLSIHSIDVISLDEGNVEIEIVHQYTRGFDECRKIIAPLLSEIVGEHIAVKSEESLERKEGYSTVVFASAKEYEVETGIAGAAKGGDLLSGDSFSTIELGNGKFAVALSDGMGNGERARAESSTALSILQQLLQSGMDEKLAIKSVNSVLMLRSSDEVYATVDVALIDQYTAQTTFLKIGSTPSFIKRGSEVFPVTANNLPVGILADIDVDLVSVQLEHGDTLIMMTDGIYDAPGHAVNKEMWMKRMITEIEADSPQDFADILLERVVRYHHGEIYDDMTVVVARVDKFQPEWATFSWPGMERIERPRTVS
ncbi:stage II sporulation protein E [Paenibacillus mucilaginosus]|uniref:Stage II sporulation protein E n=3 Tax=Paenibacillus mucilaginosus TaxID=61624 RepID=H6NSF5_9BACL|nr:stage II sporulation protein E [Paenibacillus mucilaginosus]AFC33705.1 stage II sporulation protein E [Paenibacillus mucilaginosus 3016]AFH66039.1 stage II sporulation protein E [Paenibacillus mucilaginosus K02]MCG7217914.1 stage II sporulation protein E [Paenibacillus mucilaginosus]WDM27418.1 stage II sporulation protein E [Paenibacillus mucilaginosus]WFA22106.1 stage II sporulation protein E [Paenibacillus mucilaginosus]